MNLLKKTVLTTCYSILISFWVYMAHHYWSVLGTLFVKNWIQKPNYLAGIIAVESWMLTCILFISIVIFELLEDVVKHEEIRAEKDN